MKEHYQRSNCCCSTQDFLTQKPVGCGMRWSIGTSVSLMLRSLFTALMYSGSRSRSCPAGRKRNHLGKLSRSRQSMLKRSQSTSPDHSVSMLKGKQVHVGAALVQRCARQKMSRRWLLSKLKHAGRLQFVKQKVVDTPAATMSAALITCGKWRRFLSWMV